MACANRVGGVAYLKVDGFQYALRGELTIEFQDFVRTEVVGQDGMHGYTEAPHADFISATITDLAGLSVRQLEAVTCSTVTAELHNGKVYILRDAFTTDVRPLNTAEGSIAVKFVGVRGEELLAA
jgi:Phage tail tube protein